MYDYMKALQERFDKKPPERLVRAVQSAREEVREGMDDENWEHLTPTTPMRNKRRRMHTQRTKNAPSAGWFSPQCGFSSLLTI